MTHSAPRKYKRLAPEVRRGLILDVTANIVRTDGLATVTIDKVASVSGISKPLVYKYFPNRLDLLKALLSEQVRRRGAAFDEAAREHDTFHDILRSTIRAMLDFVRQNGVVIQQLASQPELASVLYESNDQQNRRIVKFMIDNLRDQYDIPDHMVEAVVEIGHGLSNYAARYLERTKDDPEFVEDVLFAMITGGLSQVASEISQDRISDPRREEKNVSPPRVYIV